MKFGINLNLIIKNDQYLQIVSNAMAGMNAVEHVKNVNKIITNVAKETVIEK